MGTDLEWWKAELVGLLGSSKDLPPSDVIAEIRDLAAAMGLDVSEALLDTYPELYNYGPALTKAHRRQVFAQNKAEVDQILEQDLDGPVSFRDVAHRRTVELYDRLAEVFAWVDIRDCRRLVMVGCGLKPFTIFHFHDKTSIPEIVGLDVEPEAIEATTSLATKTRLRTREREAVRRARIRLRRRADRLRRVHGLAQARSGLTHRRHPRRTTPRSSSGSPIL